VSDTVIGQGADLIAIIEVAAILSVSKRTAATLAASADFPRPFKLSARAVRYSKASVLEWLKTKQEKGSDKAD
jgi:predicted DNA-binding transcriptional regulator AlpA